MNEEKLLKLIKIVDKGVSLENLRRLVDGDLSHIGDALIEGKTVRHINIPEKEAIWFVDPAEHYKVIEPRITVGSVSFPKPITEAPEIGTVYWFVGPGRLDGVADYEWNGDSHDRNILKRGFIHLTKESALECAEALVKINLGEF